MRPVVVKWRIEALNSGRFELRILSERYPVESYQHYPSIEEVNKALALRFEI